MLWGEKYAIVEEEYEQCDNNAVEAVVRRLCDVASQFSMARAKNKSHASFLSKDLVIGSEHTFNKHASFCL